ncbi:MAG: NAD(P)-dependent alcohol dehydrogenase, partial [Crocinitomicaceae bacterium]|nr:NAD(P)-dependent alcohol dehydrogenase [Crocinitomicaceae bacterium]
MKAVLFYNYGTPEVLQVENISKPSPKENELLVRIYATAVNSGDVRLRKADPFAVRFMLGLTKPKVNILGGVFSGVVESVGKNVSKFKPGDEIFGSTNMKFGAYAEYKCFDENETIALKPSALKHEQAAVLPFGGTTALHFLNKASLQKGQKILIYGASGSVGTAAVQLAKYLGAEVTAVCSTSNIELVKSLGADHVFDYTQG